MLESEKFFSNKEAEHWNVSEENYFNLIIKQEPAGEKTKTSLWWTLLQRRSLHSNFPLNPNVDSLRWSETALAATLINPTCGSWKRPFESWVVCLLLLPQPNSIPSSKNVPPFFLCPLTSPLLSPPHSLPSSVASVFRFLAHQ